MHSHLTMPAQSELIFRLLLKMTVGKDHSDNVYFWKAAAQRFYTTTGGGHTPCGHPVAIVVCLACTPACPERVGTALTLQPLGGTAVVQNGLVPPDPRAGQRCVDVLPKLLWCAYWRLGAGLVDGGPKEG